MKCPSISTLLDYAHARLPSGLSERFRPHGAGQTLHSGPAVGSILTDPTVFVLNLAAAFMEQLCIFRGQNVTLVGGGRALDSVYSIVAVVFHYYLRRIKRWAEKDFFLAPTMCHTASASMLHLTDIKFTCVQ